MNFKHGHCKGYRSVEYSTWRNIKVRCLNPNSEDFKDYGGRGIKICDKWINSFPHFLQDMGQRPKGFQIDRIDNDKGYEPSNCRWVAPKPQQRNRSDNRFITAFGRTKTLAEWCEETGFGHKLISRRLDRGWAAELAISTPRLRARAPTKKEYENLHRI